VTIKLKKWSKPFQRIISSTFKTHCMNIDMKWLTNLRTGLTMLIFLLMALDRFKLIMQLEWNRTKGKTIKNFQMTSLKKEKNKCLIRLEISKRELTLLTFLLDHLPRDRMKDMIKCWVNLNWIPFRDGLPNNSMDLKIQ